MGAVVENVRSRLVNRDSPRIGSGIGLLLTYVELKGFEFIVAHDVYLFLYFCALLCALLEFLPNRWYYRYINVAR
jgi:hypothetical protein